MDWALGRGLGVDRWVRHLDLEAIRPGDRVLGTLPVHLAAAVCERGARYVHLSLELPADQRGHELTGDELEQLGARLESFEVRRITSTDANLT